MNLVLKRGNRLIESFFLSETLLLVYKPSSIEGPEDIQAMLVQISKYSWTFLFGDV